MKRWIAAFGFAFSGLAWGTPADETLILVSRTVELQANENLGLLTVTFKVKNPTGRALEGDVRFMAPAGGAVYQASLSKHISSTERKSRLVSPDQGSALYALDKDSQRESVDQTLTNSSLGGAFNHSGYHKYGYSRSVLPGTDPAILESVSDDRYRLRFFPVPAHDDQTVSFRIAFEVPREGEAYAVRVPMDWDTPISTASDATIETRVAIRSADALGPVTCVSHRLGSIQRDREAHRFTATVETSGNRADLVLSYGLSSKARLQDFSPPRAGESAPGSVRSDDPSLRAVRAKRSIDAAPESDRAAAGLASGVVSAYGALMVMEAAAARDLARSDDRSFRTDLGASSSISDDEARQCDFVRAAAGLSALARGTPCGVHLLSTNSAAKVEWAKDHGLTVNRSGVLLATSSIEYVKHNSSCPLHEPNPGTLREAAGRLK